MNPLVAVLLASRCVAIITIWTPSDLFARESDAPPLNNPNAYQVLPGPAGEQYLETPAPAPAIQGQPSAAALAEPAPAAAPTQDKAIDLYGNPWTEERKALAKEANELGKRFAQQYRAAKRPVFRIKFHHEYPTMSEEEIEVLVNDAVEEALRQEAQRLGGGPVMRPPVTCTSSRIGSSTFTDCY